MELGDIVTLKSHPYLYDIGNIIISGESLHLPPLMIIVEIFESIKKEENKFVAEYTCLWFSSKTHKFERSKIKGAFLKLIFKAKPSIEPQQLVPGDLVSLATVDYELAKRKSAQHYEDTSINQGNGNTTINALLSFLPPILQCVDIKEIKDKTSETVSKGGSSKRTSGQYAVKCLWFNNIFERFSEELIPLEALKMISVINEGIIDLIAKSISLNKTLKITNESVHLIKPRSITSRSGYYFLRGYDYIVNSIIEVNIKGNDTIQVLDTPFTAIAPELDIAKHPNSCTAEFIFNELVDRIKESDVKKAFIRIKYKNRNDQLSTRSLKDYKIVEGIEGDNKLLYLVGYCMLRKSTRTFKISRIQNFQQLDIQFS